MKKILFAVLWLLIGLPTIAAYTPTSSDLSEARKLDAALTAMHNKLSSGDQLTMARKLRSQTDILVEQIHHTDPLFIKQGDRLVWLLGQIKTTTQNLLNTHKAQTNKKANVSGFVALYASGVSTTGTALRSGCKANYDYLDNLALVKNVPTELLIATRYRESNCSMSGPANAQWPYQIISKTYATGALTTQQWRDASVDAADFFNNKRNRYNRVNQASGMSIGLTYDSLSYTGLLRTAALYNGLSGANIHGEIYPTSMSYFDANYATDTGYLRDGIMGTVIKVAQREQSL